MLAGNDGQECYSLAEFNEFFKETCLTSKERNSGWVFRRRKRHDDDHQGISSACGGISIQQKIDRLLLKFITSFSPWESYYLVQFWAPKVVEGRCYLTTSDQPFALRYLIKGLCWHRKHCMGHRYFVGEGAKEDELGPPGRVFRNGHHESSPDFRLYSTTEHPHRDHAASCGVRAYIALPIFDSLRNECLGVLEILTTNSEGINRYTFARVEEALEEVNQRSTHIKLPRELNKAIRQPALSEINEMLKVVTNTSQLSFMQVWVPCNQCAIIEDNLSCMERALDKSSLDYWFQSYLLTQWMNQFQKIETGKGIVGILLASEHKSCFCPDLTGFSITEHPQAHHTQMAGLDVCFAICLQSSYTGNDLYIIEFFLTERCRRCEDLSPFLNFLLPIMKQTLKSFKLASGKQLGEELVVEVITFGNNYGFTFSGLPQPGIFPLRFEIIPYGQEMQQNQQVHFRSDGLDSGRNVAEEAEQNNIAAADIEKGATITTMKSKRERNKMSLHIRREDLELHFGKTLNEVEIELGVSRSTLKRACRDYGIVRWPSNEKNKKNPSLFEATTANKRVQGSEQQNLVSSSCSLPPLELPPNQNVLHTDHTIESSQHVTKLPEADVVTVKATFRDDTVKFQLCLSSGMEKLTDEVARRFSLKIGSFKLKYEDEDDQWILLACDDDLQLCMKTLTSLGKTPIKVLVQPIHN